MVKDLPTNWSEVYRTPTPQSSKSKFHESIEEKFNSLKAVKSKSTKAAINRLKK